MGWLGVTNMGKYEGVIQGVMYGVKRVAMMLGVLTHTRAPVHTSHIYTHKFIQTRTRTYIQKCTCTYAHTRT